MVRSEVLLDISVYEDPLCPWCFVAQTRLARLKADLGLNAVWRVRPYPLWLHSSGLPSREREAATAEVQRARKEPEGKNLSTELWESTRFSSSLPALMALEAARLQGESRFDAMRTALQQAALFGGIDVSREDTLLELAAGQDLHMDRFFSALRSGELRELILGTQSLAQARGVTSAPTLVINGRWMVSGVREMSEYQELFFLCLKKLNEGRRKSATFALH